MGTYKASTNWDAEHKNIIRNAIDWIQSHFFLKIFLVSSVASQTFDVSLCRDKSTSIKITIRFIPKCLFIDEHEQIKHKDCLRVLSPILWVHKSSRSWTVGWSNIRIICLLCKDKKTFDCELRSKEQRVERDSLRLQFPSKREAKASWYFATFKVHFGERIIICFWWI